jgi:enolase-phosphatase E1
VRTWFDTSTSGPKTRSESYLKIVKSLKDEAGGVLFFSDNEAELKAAKEMGMKVLLVDRPGNPELSEEAKRLYDVIESLNDVDLAVGKGRVKDTAKRARSDEEAQAALKRVKTGGSRAKGQLSAPGRRSQRIRELSRRP